MNWITNKLAVGDIRDYENRHQLHKLGVTPVDVREYWDENDDVFDPAEIDSLVRIYPSTKIMIICDAGMDRSPFVAAYYLVVHNGMTFPEAYALVKKGRPQTIEHYEWVTIMEDFLSSVTEEPKPKPKCKRKPKPVKLEIELEEGVETDDKEIED